jgi:ribose transport system permease protein
VTIQPDLGVVAQDKGARRWPWALIRNLLGYRESGIFIALLVIFVALLIISPTFGSRYNLYVVTLQMATIAIMATGQTLVIIAGAFDVSQAAVTGFSAMVTGLLAVNAGLNPFLALGLGLGTGALCGAINGILAARFKLHPIIMTLATAVMFTSLTYVLSHGEPVLNLPAPLLWMGGGSIGPFPATVAIMLLVVAVMQVLLTRTRFGLRVRQVGGNVEAARLTGVNVAAIMLGVFIISGLLSAFGALIEMGRIGAALPTIGSTLLFPIITSSILGGTLLSGGEGSMVGTLFGAAVLTIINNALVILQVDPYAQGVAQGGLVVAALIVDQFRRRQLSLRDLIRPEL